MHTCNDLFALLNQQHSIRPGSQTTLITKQEVLLAPAALTVCLLYSIKRLQAARVVLIILRCTWFVMAASLHFIIGIGIICGCHGAQGQPPSKTAKKKMSWSHLLPAAQTA